MPITKAEFIEHRDYDQNGVLSHEEYEQAEAAWALLDVNGDNQLTPEDASDYGSDQVEAVNKLLDSSRGAHANQGSVWRSIARWSIPIYGTRLIDSAASHDEDYARRAEDLAAKLAVKKDPAIEERAQFNMGITRANKGDHEGAAKAFLRASNLREAVGDDDSPRYWVIMALYQRSEVLDAISKFKMAEPTSQAKTELQYVVDFADEFERQLTTKDEVREQYGEANATAHLVEVRRARHFAKMELERRRIGQQLGKE